MIQTRKSDPSKPVRILAYGVEGVGKSTLGAKSDKPIFISPEGGTDQLTDASGNPVHEMIGINSWDTLRNSVRQLLNEKHEFKTLVLDSADWIEGLCHAYIIGNSGKSIITCNGGYGAGYRQSQSLHKELIDDLSALREKRGMNIVITAHAHVKPVKDPGIIQDYDQFEIKCHEFVSSLWREWVDGLFFIRFRTFVAPGEDTTRARALSDGTRVLYTVKQPAFQAKNRYGMPAEMDFTPTFWNELLKYSSRGETVESIHVDIQALLETVTNPEMKAKATAAYTEAGSDLEKLSVIKKRLIEIKGEK